MINEKMAHQGFSLSIRNLINMTNGVVGLSILTMPFCFEQVFNIILSILLFEIMIHSIYNLISK